jgi:hypothetical protein
MNELTHTQQAALKYYHLIADQRARVEIARAAALDKSGKGNWVEEAREHLRIFDAQHPAYGIEKDVRKYLEQLAFNTRSKRWRNYTEGAKLAVVAEWSEAGEYMRGDMWSGWRVTDRRASFFACHNRQSNVLYYELPRADNTGCTKTKVSLYRETMRLGREFPLWVAAIRNELNAERAREMLERVGEENYLAALEAKVLHEDVDSAGNERKLLEIKNYSPACEMLLVLRVVCPSTGRVYFLKPPRQAAKTCEEAAASLFDYPITFRHGDVGITMVDENGRLIEQSLVSES